MGHSPHMFARILLGVAVAASLALAARTTPAGAAVGRADVRLVRLISEVPDSIRAAVGPVHDLRLRLIAGNVVLVRKGGDFAAILPIERAPGTADSLRYFYYLERAPMLWVLPGGRAKGIRTVPDGGRISFNSFRLAWGRGADGLGWIYFPETPENATLKFSVVSGRSVDRADPKDTKYWIELGAAGAPGF